VAESNTTFDELGIPFPLFTAPIREATEYRADGHCEFCGVESGHTFRGNLGVFCYACLRAGAAQFSKYTVIGSVLNGEQLEAIGINAAKIIEHGFHNLRPHPLEPNEADWHSIRTTPGLLTELTMTPNFNCWSDCTWLFCCQRPMIYRGI